MIKMRCNMTYLIMWHHWHQHWHHIDSFVNGTIAFLRSRQLKWGATCFWSCDAIGSRITWCLWNLCHVMRLSLVSALCEVDSIISDTIAFLRSRLSKWGTMWHFGHVTPLILALMSCHAYNFISWTIAFLKSRWSKWGPAWHLVMWHHLY